MEEYSRILTHEWAEDVDGGARYVLVLSMIGLRTETEKHLFIRSNGMV